MIGLVHDQRVRSLDFEAHRLSGDSLTLIYLAVNAQKKELQEAGTWTTEDIRLRRGRGMVGARLQARYRARAILLSELIRNMLVLNRLALKQAGSQTGYLILGGYCTWPIWCMRALSSRRRTCHRGLGLGPGLRLATVVLGPCITPARCKSG